MKDQYAGDITDYIKFAFLRAFMGGNINRLGVAWFHVAGHDGKTDGGYVEYLDDSRFGYLDSELFNLLSKMVSQNQRNIYTLEKMDIWPPTKIFHGEAMPKKADRIEWFAGLAGQMNGAGVVFTDPDNGISSTQRSSPKHIYISELLELAEQNKRPVICIQFPGRHKKHPDQISDLLAACKRANPCILTTQAKFKNDAGRTNVSKRWFIILNSAKAQQRIVEFANRMNKVEGLEADIHPSVPGLRHE